MIARKNAGGTVLVAALAATLGCLHPKAGDKPVAAAGEPAPPAHAVRQVEMPELPRVATVTVPPAVVSFHGAEFEFSRPEGMEFRGSLLQRGKGTPFAGQVGEIVTVGDFLVRASRPEGNTAESASLRIILEHLPSLRGEMASPLGRPPALLAPGDVLFFPNGFVALSRTWENRSQDIGDDSASLVVNVDGRETAVRLAEFHSLAVGEVRVCAGNIYPGTVPGEGQVVLQLVAAGEEGVRRTLSAGSLVTAGPYAIRLSAIAAERADGAPGPVALLTIGGAPSGASYSGELLPGEGVSFEGIEVLVDEIEAAETTGGQVRLRTHLLPSPVVALASPGTRPKATAAAPTPAVADEPGIATRTIRGGESIEFKGLQIKLRKVLPGSRNSLTDDRPLFTVETPDKDSRDVEMKPGWRETFRSGNLWWVVTVKESHWSRNALESSARIEIETGNFLKSNQPGAR